MSTLRRRKSRGQGLVEFALVFPVFIVLVFALFDVGRAVFAYNEITNAAREGARLAMVNQHIPMIEDRIASQSTGTAVDHCIYFIESDSVFPTCDQNTMPPSDECPSDLEVGCIAHVEVWAEWSPVTPIISSLLGPFTLTANSEEPIEFVCPNPDIEAWNDPNGLECPKTSPAT
jgi:TadE-like protein